MSCRAPKHAAVLAALALSVAGPHTGAWQSADGSAGALVTGLSRENSTQVSGRFVAAFSVTASVPDSELVLTATSETLDPFLVATSPSGKRYINDDHGATLNAQVQVPKAEAGEWRVAITTVTALGSEEERPFRLMALQYAGNAVHGAAIRPSAWFAELPSTEREQLVLSLNLPAGSRPWPVGKPTPSSGDPWGGIEAETRSGPGGGGRGGGGGGRGGGGGARMPLFPWPPPSPSATQVIDTSAASARYKRLGDVDKTIRDALALSRYDEYRYFAVPDGFAIVTRLEQIDGEGNSQPVPDRWSTGRVRLTTFSIRDYLRALFLGRPGFYRVIVFVVTSRAFSTTLDQVDRKKAQEWQSTGGITLPSELAAEPFSAAHTVTALVYEFERATETAPIVLQSPGRLTGRLHLEKAKLLPALLQ